MAYGKIIHIYLADGTPTGIRYAEVVNWTGQALVCPRSRFKELSTWNEARRPGVYFLFGTDEATGKARAYIGEAENAYVRVAHHVETKDFWQEAVLFTSKDDHLTKAHVKYLESCLVQRATQAHRYQLENGNDPKLPKLHLSQQAAMEEFQDNIELVLGALGHKLLEAVHTTGSVPEPPPSLPRQFPVLHLTKKNTKTGAVAEAAGAVVDEGFVVFAGSTAASVETTACPDYILDLRRQYQADDTLIPEGGLLRFTRDTVISSPSAAAAVVCGQSANGRESWKDANGTTLKDLEAQMLQALNGSSAKDMA